MDSLFLFGYFDFFVKDITLPMDTFVFEYVIRGTGYLTTENNTVELHEGDLYIINTKYPQCYYSDRNDPFEKIWVNATGKLLEKLFPVYLPDRQYYIYHRCEKAYSILVQIHRTLIDDMHSRAEALSKASLLIHELLIIMHRAYVKHDQQYEPAHITSRKEAAIKEYLDRSVYTDISLDDISKRYFISKNHIIRLFSKEYGITPMQYLLHKRLEICNTLLKNTDLTLAQIATQLCFSSPQHLSAAYKKVYGHNIKRN